jgi:hypothetical protein
VKVGAGGGGGAVEPAGDKGVGNGPIHVTCSEIIHKWLLEHRPIEAVPVVEALQNSGPFETTPIYTLHPFPAETDDARV